MRSVEPSGRLLARIDRVSALLCVMMLCGCASELTEIIVIVDSELAVPGELDEIVVTTEGASGLPKGASANLVGAGAASMPVTVGLRPGGAQDGPVTIRVRGRLAGAERVSAQIRTRFVVGARLVLRIDLAAECVGILCDANAETCRNGFCVPSEVDPAELPRFNGTLPGMTEDAGRDLGPRDGGLDPARDGALICTSSADCDDGNPCTDDACGPIGCSNTANSAPCNDGSACTLADTCRGGACAPGASIACTDGNPCTSDGCDPSIGCVFPAFDGPCNDGNACTTGEVCSAGSCGGGGAVSCLPSGAECRRTECQPAAGGCVDVTTMGGFCDDGDYCTALDVCSAGGFCQGGFRMDPCGIKP